MPDHVATPVEVENPPTLPNRRSPAKSRWRLWFLVAVVLAIGAYIFFQHRTKGPAAQSPQLTGANTALPTGFASSSITNWFTWPSRFWSVGPAVTQTLFDGGLRRATVQQFRATYEETVARYRETVLTAFQQVEDNLSALRQLSTEIQQQDTAVQSAKRNLILATQRYRLGIDPYLNVITAQTTLLSTADGGESANAADVGNCTVNRGARGRLGRYPTAVVQRCRLKAVTNSCPPQKCYPATK
jgi:hypothetical protein